jgi:geranylgeranylglycerol-phosphate geranylgeranyltransferase
MLDLPARPAVSTTLATLVRIRSCVAGGVLGLLGAGLAGDVARGWLAAVSLACAIAFAHITNDIADYRVDRIGKPYRPLPSGALSVGAARAMAGVCAASCLLAAAARPATLLFAVALLGLSWLYSTWLKSTVLLGNVLVALLASSTVTFGAVAVGHLRPPVFAIQVLVLAFSLTFELVKTALDIEGDTAAGLRTVATRLGLPATARLAGGMCMAFVATTPWPVWHHGHPLPYLVAMAAGGTVPGVLVGGRVAFRARTIAELGPPFRVLRLMWLTALLPLTLVLL